METTARYRILETPIGPLISESRVTVYDVLEAHDNGLDKYQICMNYNLTPLQVETALDYIAEHRERLEPELREILRKAEEREAHYRAEAEKVRGRIAQKPMTPQRAAFYALLEENRRRRAAEEKGADRPE